MHYFKASPTPFISDLPKKKTNSVYIHFFVEWQASSREKAVDQILNGEVHFHFSLSQE